MINLVIYSEAFDTRAHGERLLGILLFLTTALYSKLNPHRLNRFILNIIYFTIFGIVLSLILPQLFLFALEEVNAKSVLSGRGFGFYLQPNSASMALCFFYAIYVAVKKDMGGWVLPLLVFFSLLLTASRAGLFFFISYYLIVYLNQIKFFSPLGFIKGLPKLLILFVAAIMLLISSISIYKLYVTDVDSFGGMKRLESMLDMKYEQSDEYAKSGTNEREEAALSFAVAVVERPIGYGLGVQNTYRESGYFTHSSHNQFLLVSFEMGILGLFFYLCLIFYTTLLSKLSGEKIYVRSFCYLLFFYGFFINNILTLRFSYFCLGIIFISFCYSDVRRTARV